MPGLTVAERKAKLEAISREIISNLPNKTPEDRVNSLNTLLHALVGQAGVYITNVEFEDLATALRQQIEAYNIVEGELARAGY